jgi:hypothetical protein
MDMAPRPANGPDPQGIDRQAGEFEMRPMLALRPGGADPGAVEEAPEIHQDHPGHQPLANMHETEPLMNDSPAHSMIESINAGDRPEQPKRNVSASHHLARINGE